MKRCVLLALASCLRGETQHPGDTDAELRGKKRIPQARTGGQGAAPHSEPLGERLGDVGVPGR